MAAHEGGEAAFREAYASLNAAQKQAVDTIGGPVLVLAGPGTGKTQVLTLRIANILRQTDTLPENILALTFTESGTRAMRARLRGLIGDAAYRVSIHTFHGFCGELIGDHPEAYPSIVGGRALTELERVEFLTRILEEPGYTRLRPPGAPERFLRDISGALKTLKQEYVRPDDLAAAIERQRAALEAMPRYHEKGAHKGKERRDYQDAKKRLERNEELLAIFRSYQALLTSERRYDFEDMIIETVRALEQSEELLREVQEQYQYVLADEHQDVNASQNRILELITAFHPQPNLFVVGDEKQAIYRFQGASLDNFLYFAERFGEPTSIALTDNYRSGQRILDAAHSLIATDDPLLAPLRVPLSAVTHDPGTVSRRNFPHAVLEETWLTEAIEAELAAGTPAGEIAVIVRTNRQVEHFAERLRAAGVPAAASAESDVLYHPLTVAVRALLSATASPSETALATVLNGSYWGIATADRWRVLAARSREWPLAALLADAEKLVEIGVGDPAACTHILATIEAIRSRQETEPAHRLLEALLRESGLLAHATRTDPVHGPRVLRRLYDEASTLVEDGETTDLSTLAAQFERYAAHGLPLTAPSVPAGQAAVSVMTAHKAKGLEFTVVFMPQLAESVWSVKQRASLFDLPVVHHETSASDAAEDDERRLFYVALTRAKRRLELSVAKEQPDGREAVASRFLTGLDPASVTDVPVETPADFDPSAMLAALPAPTINPDLLIEHVRRRGLSATAFNNYRQSPWQYIFKNVLRIPEVKGEHLQFGTAIHETLERLVRECIAAGKRPEIDAARPLLEQALAREALSQTEAARQLTRGLAALESYLPALASSASEHSRTEFSVSVTLPTGLSEFPEVRLTGNLDRLDRDETGRVLRVVDYKTGKPKTRGQIMGTTKDSDGNYYRQLVFYAFLLTRYPDERFHTRTGVLSFVQPSERGEVTEEVFTITKEEIDALEAEIIEMVRAIVSGQCLEVACDPATCEYCHLLPRAGE